MNYTAEIIVVCLIASPPVASAGKVKPDEAGFRNSVRPLLTKYCIACHGKEEAEGKLSLHAITPDMFATDNLETWRMIYEQVRFKDMPPTDADQPSGAERQTLLSWIRGELLKTQLPGVFADQKLRLPQFGNYVDHQFLFETRLPRVYPAAPRIWRLRPDIYDSRMAGTGLSEGRDALANGLSERDGSDFKDYASSYFIDEAGTTPLLGNAKKLAAGMVSQKRGKSRELKTLTADKAPNPQVVHKAIGVVFDRVIGRRPTLEEQQRFVAFYETAKSKSDHIIAANALVTAILMQPEFFFRTELGDGQPDEHGRLRLSQTEIAYALSYALGDDPGESFLTLAREEKLATASEVPAAVRERLSPSSPRIREFFREYFHYPFASEVFKDQPEGGEHDARMLIDDLEVTIKPILKRDKNVLAELLTTRKFFVNAMYKTEKNGATYLVPRNTKTRKYQTAFSLPIDWKWSTHLQPVEFAREERAGVLTHPAWLAAWSGNFDNHPVQRGKWIRTHLLGGTVPDVPIGVDARVPELEHKTFRERLRMATSAAECWRCHRKMDPLGVPFERYDHYGRFQRKDAGQPVDTSGLIGRTGVAELDGTKISGPSEMMQILSKSRHVEQVFVRHAFRFFLGRNETLGDANTLQDAHKAYRDNEGSFKELVVSFLTSDSFLFREAPTASTELMQLITQQ